MTKEQMEDYATYVKRDIDIAADLVEGHSTYIRFGGTIDEAATLISGMQIITYRYPDANAVRKDLLDWLIEEQEILREWSGRHPHGCQMYREFRRAHR
jgi:hypothetical protein